MFENTTLSQANLIHSIAIAAQILGAVIVLIGTAVAFQMDAIKERHYDERIAKNETDTAEANAKVAVARLETVRLKESVAERRLSERQYRAIVSKLSGSKLHIIIRCVNTDKELQDYAADFYQAFTDAGLNVKRITSVGTYNPYGVVLRDRSSTPELLMLIEALERAKIQHTYDFRARSLEIIIGLKQPIQTK